MKAVVVLRLSGGGILERTLHRGTERIQSGVLEGLSLTPLQLFGW